MRLLMVGPWRTTAMRRHIDWAVASGIEVCVADFWPPDHAIPSSSFQFSALLPRQAKAIHQPGVHKKSPRAVQMAALRLQSLARTFRPHLVHSYMLDVYTEMCLQAGLQPLVVSAWGYLNSLMTTGATAKDKRWLRRLRRDSATLLVENPNLVEALAGLTASPLRVECFPIGVDGQVFHPGYRDESEAWRFVLDIPSEATVLLSPRGWSQLYGQHDIMRAFADASHQLNDSLVLVLLGMGRKRHPEVYAQEVLDLGASLGVSHAIRWIPQIPHRDMPGMYALADIIVNYPSVDAFPSTLLEAAACARPVITSDLPAYRNTFVEQCFKLVEPKNPEALAEAIVELVGSGAALWRAKAQSTRRLVLDEYDEAAQRKRLLTLYGEIIRRQESRVRAPSKKPT